MKIAIVQFQPELFDYASNSEKLLHFAETVEADLICFPELSTTGYFFQNREQSKEYAEPCDGKTYQQMSKIAQTHNKILVYGYPEIEDGLVYNSSLAVFPERKYDKSYRKSHLFYKEQYAFEPGNSGFFVIEYAPFDLRLGMMICYDWRFPEAARSLAIQGADLIVCPSNLVTHLWPKVMPARAVENKVYLAVANRIGKEQYAGEELVFNGRSAIYGYNGQTLCVASEDKEEIIYADIDPKKTRDKSFNEFNDIFNDRRPAIYLR